MWMALLRRDIKVKPCALSGAVMVGFDSVSVDCLGEECVVETLEAIGGPFIVLDDEWALPFRFQFG
jgi:hypothetical protein